MQLQELQARYEELRTKLEVSNRSLEVLRARSSGDDAAVEIHRLRDAVRHREHAILI